METCSKSLKAEVLWRQTWPTMCQAETAIFQYISSVAFEAQVRSEAGDRYKPIASPKNLKWST